MGRGPRGGGTIGDIGENEGTVTCPDTARGVGVADTEGMALGDTGVTFNAGSGNGVTSTESALGLLEAGVNLDFLMC